MVILIIYHYPHPRNRQLKYCYELRVIHTLCEKSMYRLFIIDERVTGMFAIDVEHLSWIKGNADDAEDLCAHGHAIAYIGDEKYEYDATVSATALYLLKSLSENHIMGDEEQMMPCCGFLIYARDNKLDTVDIQGCPNGIDWSVIHEGNDIKIVTPSGKETIVGKLEYQHIVFDFADKVEAFYKRCSPKLLPEDATDRDGYIAFWNEWHRHRLLSKQTQAVRLLL